MSSVDRQATAIRERLARRRRQRRMTRAGLLLLVVLLGALWAYRAYIRSVGSGHPGESVNLLLAAVEREAAEGESALQLQAAAILTIPPHGGPITLLSLPASTQLPAKEVPAKEVPAKEVPAGQDGAVPATGSPGQEGPAQTVAEDGGGGAEAAADFALVFAQGGIEALKDAASGLLGVPVHHYAQLDLAGFAALVDRLPDGVLVTVHAPIVYRDADGEEIFRLDRGQHRLDGQAALYFLRYRGGDWWGEVPRAQRQREFAQALARAVLEEGGLRGLRDFLEAAREQITTDLEPVQWIRLSEMAWRAGDAAIRYVLLPGRPGQGRWQPDMEAVGTLVARTFRNPSWDRADRR